MVLVSCVVSRESCVVRRESRCWQLATGNWQFRFFSRIVPVVNCTEYRKPEGERTETKIITWTWKRQASISRHLLRLLAVVLIVAHCRLINR